MANYHFRHQLDSDRQGAPKPVNQLVDVNIVNGRVVRVRCLFVDGPVLRD
jgi:hypothetical protein